MPDANEYIRISDSLFSEMRRQEGKWEKLRLMLHPRAEANALQSEDGNTSRKRHSFVGNNAMKILASAHMTYIVTMGQKWLSLESKNTETKPSSKDNDWYEKATETLLSELACSNFYTEMHEAILDRCAMGIGCMFINVKKDGALSFRHVPTGTYAIGEDESGTVNTICRTYKFTAHQAVEAFGFSTLPEKIKNAYDTPSKRSEKFEFIHIVLPNDKAQFGSDKLSPAERKWTEVHIAKEEKKIVFESGAYEFPFFITRFIRNGESPYGESPGECVMPELEDSIKIEKILDTLGMRAAMPSTLVMADQVGEVDLRAGGMTIVSPEAAQLGYPKEWATSGRYDCGLERLESKEKKINSAFYVDMLQIISGVDRQMTATEVNAREGEKILVFYPSFTLFSSDFQPAADRIFSILFRQGKLPKDPPKDLFNISVDGKSFELTSPRVKYNGRIAQALDRVQRYGLDDGMDAIGRFVQMTGDTSVLMGIDADEYLRFVWKTSSAPQAILRSQDEVEKMKKQQEAMAMEAQKAEIDRQNAAANKDNATATTL